MDRPTPLRPPAAPSAARSAPPPRPRRAAWAVAPIAALFVADAPGPCLSSSSDGGGRPPRAVVCKLGGATPGWLAADPIAGPLTQEEAVSACDAEGERCFGVTAASAAGPFYVVGKSLFGLLTPWSPDDPSSPAAVHWPHVCR